MTSLEKKQLIGAWNNGQVNDAYLEPSAPPADISTPSIQPLGSDKPDEGHIPLQDSGLVGNNGVSEKQRILPPPETEEKGRIKCVLFLFSVFEIFCLFVACFLFHFLLCQHRLFHPE